MGANLVHGTAVAVALDADGPLAGALILGSSGSGKSALALALIETCAWRRSVLVADDAVLLANVEGRVIARAPERIAGLIEVRGFGPVAVKTISEAPIRAAFELQGSPPRLPEPENRAFGAATLPVWPFESGPDGAARARVILRAILAREAARRPEPS